MCRDRIWVEARANLSPPQVAPQHKWLLIGRTITCRRTTRAQWCWMQLHRAASPRLVGRLCKFSHRLHWTSMMHMRHTISRGWKNAVTLKRSLEWRKNLAGQTRRPFSVRLYSCGTTKTQKASVYVSHYYLFVTITIFYHSPLQTTSNGAEWFDSNSCGAGQARASQSVRRWMALPKVSQANKMVPDQSKHLCA